MKIKQGFSLRRIGDEHIVIATGEENVDFTRIISLNPSAARLWKELEGKTFTEDDITRHLLDWYEIDALTARRDAEALTQAWTDAGILL